MIKINFSEEEINTVNSAKSNAHKVRRLKKILGIEGLCFEESLTKYENDEQTCPFCGVIKKIKKFHLVSDGLIVDEYKFPETTTCKGILNHKCPKNSLNPNSVEYVSKEFGVTEEEALTIIHQRNSSPFYKENHETLEEYKKFQRRDKDFFGSEEKYEEYLKKVSYSNTKEAYKEKYGEELGNLIWEEIQSKKDSSSEKFFKSKYGENYKEIMEETNRKRDSHSKQYYKRKFGSRDWEAKFNENSKYLSYVMSEKYFIDKYGEKEGKRRWEERKKRFSVTEENMIKKYGEKEGKERYRRWRLSTINGGVSKESLNFFIPIYKELRKMGLKREEIYFGIGGSREYFLSSGDGGFKLFDFTIPKIKIIIEYHGSVWHFNPNFNYPDNFKSPYNGYSISELKENDERKRKLAEDAGFTVFEVFDTDDKVLFKENFIKYVKERIAND